MAENADTRLHDMCPGIKGGGGGGGRHALAPRAPLRIEALRRLRPMTPALGRRSTCDGLGSKAIGPGGLPLV